MYSKQRGNSMNYTIGDFIIRIKNAVMAHRKKVTLPYAKITKDIAGVLVKEKFLTSVKEEEHEGKKVLVAEITYDRRVPMFTDVKIISRPSLRVYAKASETEKLRGRGLGRTIVSTSAGVMTGDDAVKKGVGGLLLFTIW